MAEISETRRQLAEVDAAISAVLGTGQAYRIADRSVTRADLSVLRELKKELEAAVAAEDASPLGRVYKTVFEGR